MPSFGLVIRGEMAVKFENFEDLKHTTVYISRAVRWHELKSRDDSELEVLSFGMSGVDR